MFLEISYNLFYLEILKQRKEILKKVLNLKKISLNLDNLEHDLILYKRLKIELDVLRKVSKNCFYNLQ